MKIKRLDKPISYWYDKKDCNIVYVLYQSFSDWDKVLLGKIQLQKETLVIYCDTKEDESFISSFMTDAYSPKTVSYLQMGNGGNDNQIKKHIHDIIVNVSKVELQNYDVKQLLLHTESDKYQYTYTDVKLLSKIEIVELIEQNMLIDFKSGDLKKSFYCGITNDVDIRMEQHRTSNFSIADERVCAYVCANVEVAKQVEKLLGEAGYDIGGQNAAGNGAAETSCIVYFLKKGKLM
jgi:hypothetical protein